MAEAVPTGSLRASDAEREDAAAQLRDHAAEGRLTPEELDERLGRAFAARTLGELDELLADLPRRRRGPVPTPRDPERALARKRVAQRAGGLAITCLICVAVWAATGAGWFWPIWVFVGCGAKLARDAWALLGPDGGREGDHDAHGRGGF